MSDVYYSKTIEHHGKKYLIEHCTDDGHGAPWQEHDGHGVVSDFLSRDKKPGEVVIFTSRGRKRFYDVQATIAIAKRDGWGLSPVAIFQHAKRLGRTPTPAEVITEAVRLDMEHMRAWCNDQWHWCGIVVTPLTEDGDELRSKSESLWGIESNAGDYLDEVAMELIAQVQA